MTTRTSVYRAPALSRGLQVLMHLANCGIPKSMGQLVSELNSSFSQLYRIVVCLEEEGFVIQDTQRYYHLTDKLLLRNNPQWVHELAASAWCAAQMKNFTWQTNQPCHLAARSDNAIRVLAHAHPDFTPSISAREGSVLNTVKSSSSLLFLAMANDQDAWMLMRNYTLDHTLRGVLTEHIAGIASQGYAEIPHDRIIGLTSVSYPVKGIDGYAKAVITCPYFDQLPGDYQDVKQALETLATTLTEELCRMMFRPELTAPGPE
ncbi:helix-turn-helix domain-containing protein [Atlantibacter subterranea]|uniref:Helix-turn-helix domain-containing protein n=1 Tax=Atlantibacter subterraneus TaxID=255519 RepID=A0ABU4E1H5_9ENTR|nr:helix-turn-helix domain-containing protein [Atlantibacter subterranea]MDV7022960.1 helix-turn-helix domain-containing protein [Atlantibacter subterranea]MDZ5667782.1 helix-turn-helix domain-containing protein [Atlantibacter hermannii]